MKNLELLKSLATTKYGDWEGIVSMDGSNATGVQNLCRENGIDIEDYFIVGFGIEDGGTQNLIESHGPACSVLLLEKKKYGISADQIIENTRHFDDIEVVKKSFSVSYADLGKAVKRLSLMTIWKTRDELPDMIIAQKEE